MFESLIKWGAEAEATKVIYIRLLIRYNDAHIFFFMCVVRVCTSHIAYIGTIPLSSQPLDYYYIVNWLHNKSIVCRLINIQEQCLFSTF